VGGGASMATPERNPLPRAVNAFSAVDSSA